MTLHNLVIILCHFRKKEKKEKKMEEEKKKKEPEEKAKEVNVKKEEYVYGEARHDNKTFVFL